MQIGARLSWLVLIEINGMGGERHAGCRVACSLVPAVEWPMSVTLVRLELVAASVAVIVKSGGSLRLAQPLHILLLPWVNQSLQLQFTSNL